MGLSEILSHSSSEIYEQALCNHLVRVFWKQKKAIGSPGKLLTSGWKFNENEFNVWKNTNNALRRHKENSSHRQAFISPFMCITRLYVDSQLMKRNGNWKTYRLIFIEQIIEVVNSFTGGHYFGVEMKLLTLLITWVCLNYWPSVTLVLTEHTNTHANNEREHKSYLSKTISEKFINHSKENVEQSHFKRITRQLQHEINISKFCTKRVVLDLFFL